MLNGLVRVAILHHMSDLSSRCFHHLSLMPVKTWLFSFQALIGMAFLPLPKV